MLRMYLAAGGSFVIVHRQLPSLNPSQLKKMLRKRSLWRKILLL